MVTEGARGEAARPDAVGESPEKSIHNAGGHAGNASGRARVGFRPHRTRMGPRARLASPLRTARVEAFASLPSFLRYNSRLSWRYLLDGPVQIPGGPDEAPGLARYHKYHLVPSLANLALDLLSRYESAPLSDKQQVHTGTHMGDPCRGSVMDFNGSTGDGSVRGGSDRGWVIRRRCVSKVDREGNRK